MMKKILLMVLMSVCVMPAIGVAGVAGKYVVNDAEMLKQMMPMIIKRVPPKRRAMVIRSIKQRMKQSKRWMLLTSKGIFKGMTQRQGQKKSKLGATGTWKLEKNTVVIRSTSVRMKRKSTLFCAVRKKGQLACKDKKNPRVTVFFDKIK